MTDNLLQKLEEKMMMVISEVEELRKENQRLNHKNAMLELARENHVKKMQDLIGLIDAIAITDHLLTPTNTLVAVKSTPTMVQGEEAFG